MAFGPLKKGEKPICQVPDKDEEEDDDDIGEEIIFGDAVTDTSTSKMNEDRKLELKQHKYEI